MQQHIYWLVLGLSLAAFPAAAQSAKTATVVKPPVTPATAAGKAAPQPAAPAAKNDGIRVLIAAEQESTLAAQMSGRVDTLNVQLGASIKAGQPLLRFVCDEQDAHLKMAKAEFQGAQQTYESKLKLQAMQSVAEIEVQQAAAAVEKYKAQIQLYQAQLRLCHINAPFSGRVTKLHVKPHESVNTGQPLIEIVNDRKLKAQLHLPSNWLSWIKPGAPFSMQIDETGKSYEAKLRRLNGKVDAVSQSIEVEGEVVGDTDGLLPGMSGQASFKR
ncbi:efflux RND transporter periplasmic adaptor subunit [Massilia sp. W12]|uniref:efflux RND transporter periplasmic adaptor subunit n=1 Tax=Massilia sp. W12 TaxID=3126507 RepID=UPI0030D503DD